MTTPTPGAADPLSLGQKLVAVLEGGRRTATYKLAVMVALLDLAVESVPADPDSAVAIDLDDLTHRVMEMYWRQLRPLDGYGPVLRQSNDGRGVVFTAIDRLRGGVEPLSPGTSFESAARRSPELFDEMSTTVKQNLVRFPLKLLQNVGRTATERFLYDDAWMGTDSLRAIDAHENRLVLFPGVCHALARLAPLVKPAYQLAWVDEVRRMNKNHLDTGPDLAAHLFGADRVTLLPAGRALAEEFGSECFYCRTRVSSPRGDGGRHVDHVLPWSRVGIDGLANLVIACARCNLDKSDILPTHDHVEAALARDAARLDALADAIDWPVQFERTRSAAHGLYSTQPPSTPLWRGVRDVRGLGDVDFMWAADLISPN